MLGNVTFICIIINDIFTNTDNYNLQYDAAVNDHIVVINRWSARGVRSRCVGERGRGGG